MEGVAVGLTFAPATCRRLMNQVLNGLHWKTLLIYINDVIMISPDFATHVSRLREVFDQLRGAGLKLKLYSVLCYSQRLSTWVTL